jgi:glycosyltransferase involved in cell wall biosynthesis
MAIKVLMLLSNAFRPDPRVHKEAKALKEDAYDVGILAWDRGEQRPVSETIDGIEINRVRTPKPKGAASTAIRMVHFWVKALLKSRRKEFDVVHAHDLDTLLPGILISKLHRVPLVYDAHEHYAKMIAVDAPLTVTRLVDRLELRLVAFCSLAIVANPPMKPRLEAVRGPEIVIVANCVDLPDGTKLRAHSTHQEVVLFYGGTFEPMRYIVETIEVVKRTENAKVVFAGTGRLSDLVSREASLSPKVEFLGFLSWNALMNAMVASDAVLCLLDPRNENYKMNIANRLCEGMAYGVPVLASKDTLCGEIVQKEGAGIVIEWSPENLVKAIDELRDINRTREMGRNGRVAAEREYNWKIQKERLLESYRKVLSIS